MLQSIRDRAQGLIAWLIVGFIIITFALFGIQQYFDLNEQPAVATVNDTQITQNDFQRALQRQRQNFQSILGTNYDPKMFDNPVVKQNILDELVNENLLAEAISDNKLMAGDRQIAQLITSFPQFQKDGKFSEELLKVYLNSKGINQDYFFYQLAGDIVKQQFYQGLNGSGLVTPKELAYQSRLMGQTRNVSYLTLNYNDDITSVTVSDEEIKNYYQANSNQFMTDEKVAVEYVELSLSEMAKATKVSDAELKQYYDSNKSQYVAAEQRKASHILFTLAPNADEQEVAAVKNKALKLVGELNAGADFAAYARKYSQDPGSAQNGGDVGYVVAGSGLPKEFVDTVFSLNENQVSMPVRTDAGIHIIKVTDIKRPQKSFKQVKAQLEKDFRTTQAEAEYFRLAEDMVNIANEQPESLEPVAEHLGKKLVKTALFSRREAKGVFANPQALAAAFDQEWISTRYNSDAIELGPEHILLLRVTDYQAAVVKPFDKVKAEIKASLQKEKAIANIGAKAESLAAELNQGASRNSIARSAREKWIDKSAVKRTDRAKLDPAIIEQAFSMPKSDSPVYSSVQLGTGNYAVVAISGVKDGNAFVANAEASKRAYAENGRKTYNDYLQYLKSNAEITYNYELLN